MTTINQFWYSLDGSMMLPQFVVDLMNWNKNKVKINLWTYQKLKNVPSGVNVKNASEIVSKERFKQVVLDPKKFEGDRYVIMLFSDYFRGKLFEKINGSWWVDTDVIILRSMPTKANVISSQPRILKGIRRRKYNTFRSKRIFEADLNMSVMKLSDKDLIQTWVKQMDEWYDNQDKKKWKGQKFPHTNFMKMLILDKKLESYVANPIVFNPLPYWTTEMGAISFGYKVPELEDIKRHSITISFSGSENYKKKIYGVLEKLNIVI